MNSQQRRTVKRKTGGGEDLVERRAELAAAADSPDTFRVTISTDQPVSGMLHEREVLEHSPRAVDLSRARKGLPVTIGHGGDALPVGRVDELRLEGGSLRGRMRLSRNMQHLASDIDDGILTDGSVGARVHRDAWKERDGSLVATRWTPVHFALVATGADPGASVSRNEDSSMETTETGTAINRAQEVSALFAGLEGTQWRDMELNALRAGSEPAEVARDIDAELRRIAREVQYPSTARVEAGRDALDTWCGLVEKQLELRAGLVDSAEQVPVLRELQQAGIAEASLEVLARDYLRIRNLPMSGNHGAIIGRALGTPAVLRSQFSHTTSDFANLLAATADKSLARGYTEGVNTFQAWTRNESLSNFRQHSFPALSAIGDLERVPESGEFRHGTLSDKAETMQLREYGKLISVGRQLIINDDVGLIGRLPRALGSAALRQVGDLVYSVLTTNANLVETGRALFNTTDGNLAASGAVISTTTLDLGRVAMRTVTDPSGAAVLNIMPRYLLVPVAIETVARVQIAAEKDPDTTGDLSPNPFRNALEVIAEPRLDAASATAWYLIAGKNADVETVSLGWLNGVQRPRLEQESGFAIEGLTLKVAIDVTAAALDWRGMYSNAGA